MSVSHISEEDAAREAAEIEIASKPRMRTVMESIAILDALPGERGFMDEDFARDVRNFRARHPESLRRSL